MVFHLLPQSPGGEEKAEAKYVFIIGAACTIWLVGPIDFQLIRF
jgi:hypothetical protein